RYRQAIYRNTLSADLWFSGSSVLVAPAGRAGRRISDRNGPSGHVQGPAGDPFRHRMADVGDEDTETQAPRPARRSRQVEQRWRSHLSRQHRLRILHEVGHERTSVARVDDVLTRRLGRAEG